MPKALEYGFLFTGEHQKANYSSHTTVPLSETQLDETDAIAETAFSAWMGEIEEILRDKTGLSLADLPDIDYRAFFEAEATPYLAASAALVYGGFSWIG